MATTIDDLVPPDDLDCETFIRECAERHCRVEVDDDGRTYWAVLAGKRMRDFGIDRARAYYWQNETREQVRKILKDALTLLGYINDATPPPPKEPPIPRQEQRRLADEARAAPTCEK